MSEQANVHEVFIEKLVHGGSGLARLGSGQAVFVPGVLPGEQVIVTIRKKRKGVLEASLVSVLTPSKDRIAPPCNGEIECTGATWPHIAYPAQLKHKQEILLDTLKKIGGVEPRRLLPILPSPRRDHYRLRTQFNVRMKDGRQVLKNIRALTDKLPLLTELHINAAPSGEVHLLLFSEHPLPSMEPFFADLKRTSPEVIGMTGFTGKKKVFTLGRNQLVLEIEGITLKATEGNFFQVNWEQNRNMVRTVLAFTSLTGNETVLDLYCGIGNFALPLAKKAKSVIGIESGYSAIEDAKTNAGYFKYGICRGRYAERVKDPDPEKAARRGDRTRPSACRRHSQDARARARLCPPEDRLCLVQSVDAGTGPEILSTLRLLS
jgi:23S rRNA (uracil1939-C5)-methyltransferase